MEHDKFASDPVILIHVPLHVVGSLTEEKVYLHVSAGEYQI